VLWRNNLHLQNICWLEQKCQTANYAKNIGGINKELQDIVVLLLMSHKCCFLIDDDESVKPKLETQVSIQHFLGLKES
jgi:hypothetical protein